MPKLKVDKTEERCREVRAIILAGQARENVSDEKLAIKMLRTVKTVQNRRRDPGLYTLNELWAACDALKLNDKERAAILGGTKANEVV